MGRITVIDNPMDVSSARSYTHNGMFIDFLLNKFPNGFGGRPHTTVINLSKLEVADYDREITSKDNLVLAVMPAFDPVTWAVIGKFVFDTALGQAIVATLITTALNYAINAFFGPEGSQPITPGVGGVASGGGLPEASPTYSLSLPSNTARIGQPIPIAYGRNLLVPDLASSPYSWFGSDNQQYVSLLLCLGMGHTTIHSIKIGSSQVDDLGPGVLSYQVFPPESHANTFGIIQNATQMYENVYTSLEVSDQELYGGMAAEEGVGQIYGAELYTGTWRGIYGNWFRLDNQAIQVATEWRSRPVWGIVSNAGANDGTYLLGWMADHENTVESGDFARQGHFDLNRQWPGGNSRADILFTFVDPATLNPEDPEGVPIGPIAATPPGVTTSHLQYDITMPAGGYTSDPETGRLAPIAISVEFLAELIDNDGNVLGPRSVIGFSEIMATNTAQRRTIDHVVPEGRYQVTGFRTSLKSGQASSQSAVYWTSLKSILGNTMGGPVYNQTTLISMKIKATEGMSKEAINRISVDCTRILPRLGTTSRNPADAFIDIFTNQVYGGRRPDSELDFTTLNALKAAWASKYFDAVFDTHVSLWDALKMSVQMVHSAPTAVGSVVTVVEDANHVAGEFSFDTNNIKSLTLTFLFPDGEESDGVEGEYRDPTDGAQLFVVYPPDAVNPQQIVLFGCRDYDTALAYVTQRWKQISLRRLLVTLQTELDGHVVRVGAPVSVLHPKLGQDSVLCVVQSVTVQDEFSTTIELHRHEPGVYS